METKKVDITSVNLFYADRARILKRCDTVTP